MWDHHGSSPHGLQTEFLLAAPSKSAYSSDHCKSNPENTSRTTQKHQLVSAIPVFQLPVEKAFPRIIFAFILWYCKFK
jgi:hypothetical protein